MLFRTIKRLYESVFGSKGAVKKTVRAITGQQRGPDGRLLYPSSSGRSQTLRTKMPVKRGLTKKELHMVECKKRARVMIQLRKGRIQSGTLKRFQHGERQWARDIGMLPIYQ